MARREEFSERFTHCNKLEILFSYLEIVIADCFEPAFLVEVDGSFVAVKHGKPHMIKVHFFGFFEQKVLQAKSNLHGQKVFQNVDFLELANVSRVNEA